MKKSELRQIIREELRQVLREDNSVTFAIDDEKLDQLLLSKFDDHLDYVDVKGDSYYSLPRRHFDRFIDFADSHGFDVSEDSETSVIDII